MILQIRTKYSIITDRWYPNITSRTGHKKEHLFEEMDENHDKMIAPNEFDKDLN